MLTKAAAVELGSADLSVNAVSPGFVTVDSTANPVTEEYAAAVSANPLGRRGRPGDIAAAVAWLVSPAAEWVTGSILRVDGGASAGTTTLAAHWSGLTDVQTPGIIEGAAQ
jgi:NAD(P)-dependent dehydrogenase (short-subunit alcohol dehydrogenase family)